MKNKYTEDLFVNSDDLRKRLLDEVKISFDSDRRSPEIQSVYADRAKHIVSGMHHETLLRLVKSQDPDVISEAFIFALQDFFESDEILSIILSSFSKSTQKVLDGVRNEPLSGEQAKFDFGTIVHGEMYNFTGPPIITFHDDVMHISYEPPKFKNGFESSQLEELIQNAVDKAAKLMNVRKPKVVSRARAIDEY